MATIDPNGILQAYLREQARAQRQPGSASPPAPVEVHPAQRQEDRQLFPALQDTMAARIAAISRQDPQARRKAFRCFLEYTLKQQLGSAIGLDPGFAMLVDRVHLAMEQDPSLAGPMDKAGQWLIKTHTAAATRR